MSHLKPEETTRHLRSASTGFDALFNNDLAKARDILGTNESPFHLLGAGVCAFLEAALGMEVCFWILDFVGAVLSFRRQSFWRRLHTFCQKRTAVQRNN